MVYYLHENILKDYRDNIEKYKKICAYFTKFLKKKTAENNILTFAVENRVKSEQSLLGKLQRKGEKYSTIEDITDICGGRVICYFSDDVDKVAKIVEESFEIDKENSIDKRKLLDPSSFGYLSLHYVCSMTEEKGFPKELCGVKFELQIRSVLQHAWSAIDHDLSYKSEVGIPRNIIREFARIAGLLEIADEKFIEIRDSVNNYIKKVKEDLSSEDLPDLNIDVISLYMYVVHNKEMQQYYEEIAQHTGAAISQTSAENYTSQLEYLGVKTLKQLQEMLHENKDVALKIAAAVLKNKGVDELPLDIGLRLLCYAKILNDDMPLEKIVEFSNIALSDVKLAKQQAERLVKLKKLL